MNNVENGAAAPTAKLAEVIGEHLEPEKTSNPVWADEELPLKYYSAFYSGTAVMDEFFAAQRSVVEELCDEKLAGEKRHDAVSLVDVGCGTCEMGSKLAGSVKYNVNVDFNPVFFRLALRLHPEMWKRDNVVCVLGDACELNDLLKDEKNAVPQDIWEKRRVLTTLTNTFGILPKPIREPILRQMVEAAGPDGVAVVSCFHSGSFRRGVNEFYKMMPEMCGPLTDEMCDFDKAVFLQPETGYTSQWWSEEMLRDAVKDIDGIEVEVMVRGPGIFMIMRQKP